MTLITDVGCGSLSWKLECIAQEKADEAVKMLQCLNPCQLHHYLGDFVNMKCMSWFNFLHLKKMELCFVLFCSFDNRSESSLFEWSTFLFLVQKHWYVKFLRWVGWWGEGWVGWTAKRTTSRTCFLYISDKKGTFHFHFSDKIHIKRNFLKKRNKMAKFGK